MAGSRERHGAISNCFSGDRSKVVQALLALQPSATSAAIS